MPTVSDFNELSNTLEEAAAFNERLEAMDSSVSFDWADPVSLESAIRMINGRVDAIASFYPSNQMVLDLAGKVKQAQREQILEMARESGLRASHE